MKSINSKFGALVFLAAAISITSCDKEEKPDPKKKGATTTAVAESRVAPIRIDNPQASMDTLIIGFFDALARKDTALVSRFVVQRKEYEALYPLMPDADPNPQSPGFIAQMYVSGNKKHLDRWLDKAKTEGFVFSRYVVEGEEQRTPHYTLIKGVRLWVRDAQGEREFPAFKTLLKMPDGYKIWSILDT